MGLVLAVIALLATGCALDSTYDYQENQVVGGVYYGGYGTGYYDRDVIVAPPSQPLRASQLPARPVPRPAPRRR
jgi:hypothetical protein